MTSITEILDQIQYLFQISENEEGLTLTSMLRNHLDSYINECENYSTQYEQQVLEIMELKRHLRELEGV